ncbi:MAG: HupE/UreJ family protein [Deltaproteobacteria bacterium]|nr:HupE/UreJ family protein [Deltaproteobacteria bacterium]
MTPWRRNGWEGGVALAALLCIPSRASAHLVTTGMGPVYDGIAHLLQSPDDIVPVIALALYAGLRGAAAGRRAMFLLPIAWFIGGLAGSHVPGEIAFPLPAISFLVLGGLVAADLRMPVPAVTGLVIILGLTHGFLNGAVLRAGPGTSGLIGMMAVLFVLITLGSALVVSLKKYWSRIVVRVAGSWVAAVGLLMVGWALR